jgi:transcriptional regulator with XRE-family HTH domain
VATIPHYRRVLGENIRLIRKAAGLSQEKLAEKAELHPNYVGYVERGEQNISVDALARVARALRVSMADLLKGA